MSEVTDLVCYCCQAEFQNQDDFWHHMYEVSCESTTKSTPNQKCEPKLSTGPAQKNANPNVSTASGQMKRVDLNSPGCLSRSQNNSVKLSNDNKEYNLPNSELKSPQNVSSKEDNLEGINEMLRRLCLVELLSVIHNMDSSKCEQNSSKPAHLNIHNQDITNMIRSICREEIQAILGPELLSQIRNPRPK